jgi:hypothetical protein
MADSTTLCTVHVGVHYSQIVGTLRALREAGEKANAEGDGWYTWGEALGDDVNDPTTFHVLIETTSVIRTLRHLVTMGVNLIELGPRGHAEPGTVAVVTEVHDHADAIAQLTEGLLALFTIDWIHADECDHAGGASRP